MPEFITNLLTSPFGAFFALMVVFIIAGLVGKVTKGWVPAILIMMIILLVSFSTGIFPRTIVDDAGVSDALFKLVCGLLVTHLGTLISRKEMAAQWKTAVIALLGVLALTAVVLLVGSALFGSENAIAACPPLAGGAIATALMSEAAIEAGKQQAALVATVCLSLQGIIGYPLTSICLKKETRRLVKQYEAGELKINKEVKAEEVKETKESSPTVIIFKLSLLTLLSYVIEVVSNGVIPMYVVCLILGFIAHEIGFIETDALTKANSYGFIITLLLMGLFKTLAKSGSSGLGNVAIIAVALIIIATIAMAIMAIITSKIFKQSFWMCWAIILNCFSGFPINVIITDEQLAINTKEGEERATISSVVMPKMVVAGFVCVTIVSVLLAGVLVKFL